MDGIDSFLDGERSSLLKGDAFWSKNRRMVGMVAVVRVKCFEMTFMSWLGHCGRERVRAFYRMIMTAVAMALFLSGLRALPMT